MFPPINKGAMNNIYLVGFMGTGKTSVGKLLAKIKQVQFIDLDELIEHKEQKTIPEIFANQGEKYFRVVEKQTLQEVSLKDHCIVSCGGGVVIDQDNIELMKKSGVIICLSARVEVILERTKRSINRPLLNVADPKSAVEALLTQRQSRYNLADVVIDTSDLTIPLVVEKITTFLGKFSR